MEEIFCSIHNYTKFSGNNISFYDLAQSALDCGMDAVFTTDKNVFPQGFTQYYYRAEKRMLMLCGEELFNPAEENAPHYLSLGIGKEQFHRNIGSSQDGIRIDLNEPGRGKNFRHSELINAQDLLKKGLSAGLKEIRSKVTAFDKLLQNDQHHSGVAGTCSSTLPLTYSYNELFSTACNHVFIDEQLSGELDHDQSLILKSIKSGKLFIALDGLADAKGFKFSAEGNNLDFTAWPGDTIYLKNSITLKISIPEACLCRLIHSGKIIKEWHECKQVPYTIYEPGYYRVECALIRRKTAYDWIFTNPIYVVRG